MHRLEVTTPLNIATCPVNWNNNDLENWQPITPFPEILDRMVEAGYHATEYDATFGADVPAVRRELDTRNLQLTGSYQWVDFLERGADPDAYAELEPLLGFLAALDCRNLIVADSLRPHRVALAGRVPADGSQSLDDASYQRIADGIQTLADLAAKHDIRVHYHNHVGSWIEAPHEVSALLGHLDSRRVDLCFDTGHYAYGGGDPAAFIRDNIDHIGYLHLKDVDSQAVASARNRQLTFLEALREIVFSPIGTGTADIPAILRVLRDHKFSGWIVVEQDTCTGDPTEAARANLAFIESWLTAQNVDGRSV